MPYADNRGVRIYYHVEGAGPPLLLQHGFMGSVEDWRDYYGYIQVLKSDYRLIMIDARGHGSSDKPHAPEAYNSKLMARDVVAVLDDLKIETAHFYGYSMGGWIGFALAECAPERLRSLIIGGMHPYRQASGPMRQLLENGMEALLADREAGGRVYPPEARGRLLANDLQALLAALADDWTSNPGILPRMTMPCLVYVGEADDDYYPGAKECVKYMPNVTFVSLSSLDHWDAFSRGDLVLPHVKRFLAGV